MKVKATPEYATFTKALKKVLGVSHSELQTRLAADKERREEKRKRRASAVHASREKD